MVETLGKLPEALGGGVSGRPLSLDHEVAQALLRSYV